MLTEENSITGLGGNFDGLDPSAVLDRFMDDNIEENVSSLGLSRRRTGINRRDSGQMSEGWLPLYHNGAKEGLHLGPQMK